MQCVVYKNGNSGAGLEIPTRKVAIGGGGGGGGGTGGLYIYGIDFARGSAYQ